MDSRPGLTCQNRKLVAKVISVAVSEVPITWITVSPVLNPSPAKSISSRCTPADSVTRNSVWPDAEKASLPMKVAVPVSRKD